MNSCYWGKALIKLSTLPAVCTASTTMAVKLKKVASKLLTMQGILTGDHAVTQAMLGKGLKASWNMNKWAHKACWHMST